MEYFKVGKIYLHESEWKHGFVRKYTLIEKNPKVYIFLSDAPTPVKWSIPSYNTQILDKFLAYDSTKHIATTTERDYKYHRKTKQASMAKLLPKAHAGRERGRDF